MRTLIKLKKFKFSKIDYSYDTRDFLSNVVDYESKLDDNLNPFKITREPLKGHITSEGSLAFTKRNPMNIHNEHFKTLFNSQIKVTSLGVGTYIGAPDDVNDFYMYNGIKTAALSGGVNVIDTAINYRYMKSERVVGRILNTLVNKYNFNRNELLICSKIGYVPEDADNGKRSHSFVQPLIEENKMTIDDVVFDDKNRPVHCMHPAFLEEQLTLSLDNLSLETLDVLYLHNSFESQGNIMPKEDYYARLAKAFEFMV